MRFVWKSCLLLLAGMPSLSAGLQAQGTSGCRAAFVLRQESVNVPFTVINDFVFLNAAIDGIHGKVMFDTGTPEALVLNDHLLKRLGHGAVKGQSRVGSGQVYTETIRDCVRGVDVSGFPMTDVATVESDDLGFIEKDITPDFLGFVGYGAYPGYTFKLDYSRRQLRFAKSVHDARTSLLDGETVLAALSFTTRRRPNSPLVAVKLGGETFLATFDTGQSGSLEMDDVLRDSLITAGSLTALPGKDEDGQVVYRVNDLELTPGVHVRLPAMVINTPGSPSDKGLGITERSVIHLGFQFLSQFKTVWDWANRTLYLLQV